MEERPRREASLVVYFPSVSPRQPPSSLPEGLPSLVSQKRLDSERLLSVTYDTQSGFASSFSSSSSVLQALSPPTHDAFVSLPLSSESSVCLLRVEGMVCESCVRLIESTLAKEEGVLAVKVSLAGKEALVQFNPQLKSASEIVSAVDDMGFEAELRASYGPRDLLDQTSPALVSKIDSVLVSTASELGGGDGEEVKSGVGDGVLGEECVVIGVEGMVCQSCVSNIETNVTKAAGVKRIVVSLSKKCARVTYDPLQTSTAEVCAAIEDLGFEATCTSTESSSLTPVTCGKGEGGEVVRSVRGEGGDVMNYMCVGIEGMTCRSCVDLVETAVAKLEGVVSVRVTLATKEGVVEVKEGMVGEKEVRSAIEETGFSVTCISREAQPAMYVKWLNGF